MRRSDSGKGYANLIFALAILSVLAFVGIKTVPVVLHNYELQDYIRQLAIRATVERSPAEAIRNDVVAHAQDLELPVTRDNVKCTAGSKVTIELDYTVAVDLKVYIWVLHFTPAAENRAL